MAFFMFMNTISKVNNVMLSKKEVAEKASSFGRLLTDDLTIRWEVSDNLEGNTDCKHAMLALQIRWNGKIW